MTSHISFSLSSVVFKASFNSSISSSVVASWSSVGKSNNSSAPNKFGPRSADEL
jgi:hypothetical protein